MLNQCFLMLVQRLLRWTNIKQTLVQRLQGKDVRPRGCPVVHPLVPGRPYILI